MFDCQLAATLLIKQGKEKQKNVREQLKIFHQLVQ